MSDTDPPWGDRLAEAMHDDVADLRRIADEVDEEHAEELLAIAENYELVAESYESD